MEKCTAGKGNSLLTTLYLAVNSEVSSTSLESSWRVDSKQDLYPTVPHYVSGAMASSVLGYCV